MVDLAVILVFVDLGEEIAIDDADDGITLYTAPRNNADGACDRGLSDH